MKELDSKSKTICMIANKFSQYKYKMWLHWFLPTYFFQNCNYQVYAWKVMLYCEFFFGGGGVKGWGFGCSASVKRYPISLENDTFQAYNSD